MDGSAVRARLIVPPLPSERSADDEQRHLAWRASSGIFGLLLTAAAVLCRRGGQYLVGGVGSLTLFQAGAGVTGAGCFALLWVIASRNRD
jgi:hypothetical protein